MSICALAHMCWTVVYVHESLHVFQSASSSYFWGQNFSMNLKLDGLTRLAGWHSSGLLSRSLQCYDLECAAVHVIAKHAMSELDP